MSLLLQGLSFGNMSSSACFQRHHFAPHETCCRCKYMTKYLMHFEISKVQNRDYSSSWIQGVLRAQLSCPGTDSNLWRCTALSYLRSRAGLVITILLPLFVHQKIECVTVQYSHKHVITNGKFCWQFLLYPAKFRQMERSAMQALVLHMCINYNTVAFCYSFHLLNMYEFEWEERGTIERQTEKGSQSKLCMGHVLPFWTTHWKRFKTSQLQGMGEVKRNISNVSYSFFYKAFQGEQVLELFRGLTSLENTYTGFFPK